MSVRAYTTHFKTDGEAVVTVNYAGHSFSSGVELAWADDPRKAKRKAVRKLRAMANQLERELARMKG